MSGLRGMVTSNQPLASAEEIRILTAGGNAFDGAVAVLEERNIIKGFDAPYLVLKGGKPVMALGTPGGDGIGQRPAQGFVDVVEFEMSIQESVATPGVVYGGPPRGRSHAIGY